MIFWKCFTLLTLVFLSHLLAACLKKTSPASPDLSKIPPSVTVKVLSPEKISEILTYPARVRSQVHATLLAEKEAMVAEVSTLLGKAVAEKEVLLTLKHTDPIYQYAPILVRSPLQGVVSSIEVSVGSYVAVGQKLASVVNPKLLDLQIEVPGSDLGWIRAGLTGTFQAADSHLPAFPVRVAGVSPFVDPQTGTAPAQLKLTSAKALSFLSAGHQGQVVFEVNPHLGFFVPASTVSDPRLGGSSEPTIWLIDEQKQAHAIEVKLGKKQRGLVELLTPIPPGSLLVERTSRTLKEGEGVTLENAPGSPSKVP